MQFAIYISHHGLRSITYLSQASIAALAMGNSSRFPRLCGTRYLDVVSGDSIHSTTENSASRTHGSFRRNARSSEMQQQRICARENFTKLLIDLFIVFARIDISGEIVQVPREEQACNYHCIHRLLD